MRILICNLLLLNSIGCFSQNSVSTSSGSITFITKEHIVDQELYDQEIKLMDHLMDSILRLEILKDPFLSESERKQRLELFDSSFPSFSEAVDPQRNEAFKVQTKLIYTDTVLRVEKIRADKWQEDHMLINLKDSTYSMQSWRTPDVLYKRGLEIPYRNDSDILSLEEHRNDTKILNGFKCFKVILTVKNDQFQDDEMLKGLLKMGNTYYEMYVTTKISLPYHPQIKYKSILKKYFPLEVIQYSDLFKGNRKITVLQSNE